MNNIGCHRCEWCAKEEYPDHTSSFDALLCMFTLADRHVGSVETFKDGRIVYHSRKKCCHFKEDLERDYVEFSKSSLYIKEEFDPSKGYYI